MIEKGAATEMERSSDRSVREAGEKNPSGS
jgi:hypothetical protein